MKKHCLIASIAAFVTLFVLEFVLHGICLKDLYHEYAALWRPEADMQKLMWMMWIGYLIFSPVFVYIYSKGYEEGKSGLGQGLRFGLAIGLLMAPMSALGWYAVLPIPAILSAYWLVGGLAEFIIVGAVVGLIWKK